MSYPTTSSTRRTTSGSASTATAARSASPTTRRSSSATWSTSSCRRSGATLKQGESFGTIESVKAVSELYAPVAGEVVEVNAALEGQAGDRSTPIRTAAWMIASSSPNPGEAGALLDADAVHGLWSK